MRLSTCSGKAVRGGTPAGPALPAPRDPADVTLSGPPAGFRLTRDWWDAHVDRGRAIQRQRNAGFEAAKLKAQAAALLRELPDAPDDAGPDIPLWTDRDESELLRQHPHLRRIVPQHDLMKGIQ